MEEDRFMEFPKVEQYYLRGRLLTPNELKDLSNYLRACPCTTKTDSEILKCVAELRKNT
jgi:hypothetical protein